MTGQKNDLAGAVIDERFRLEEVLGEGGLGRVWRATQLSIDRDVAVKVLRGEVRLDPKFRKRFLREAKVISGFNHPNIVRLVDFGEDNDRGFSYLVMELVDGVELTEPARQGRFRANFALEITYQIAAALLEAHNAGIIHRDLKLENVFLVPVSNGTVQVKVLDFGVALPKNDDSRLTTAGQVFGTPAYMSPEQSEAKDVGPASDLYSLGVLLFEMLTGRLPFTGDSSLKVMMQHLEAEPPQLGELVSPPMLPTGLQALLDDLMAKDADERLGDALELRQRIDNLRRQADLDPVRLDPTAPPDRRFEPFILSEPSGHSTRQSGAVVPDTDSSAASALDSEPEDDASLGLADTRAANSADLADSAPTDSEASDDSRDAKNGQPAPSLSTKAARKSIGADGQKKKAVVAGALLGMVLAGGAVGFLLFGGASSSEGASEPASERQARSTRAAGDGATRADDQADPSTTATGPDEGERAAQTDTGVEASTGAPPEQTAGDRKNQKQKADRQHVERSAEDPAPTAGAAATGARQDDTAEAAGSGPTDEGDEASGKPDDAAPSSRTGGANTGTAGERGADKRPARDGKSRRENEAETDDRQTDDGKPDDSETNDSKDEEINRELRENLQGLESGEDWSP